MSLKFRVLDECQVCKQNEVIFRPERNGKNTPLSHKWGTGHNFVPVVVYFKDEVDAVCERITKELEEILKLADSHEAGCFFADRTSTDVVIVQLQKESKNLQKRLRVLVGELKKGGVD